MSRPVSLKALDSIGSGTTGYLVADFVTGLCEHFYPALFATEKIANSFYGLVMLVAIVGMRILAVKLEQNHILTQIFDEPKGTSDGGTTTTT